MMEQEVAEISEGEAYDYLDRALTGNDDAKKD